MGNTESACSSTKSTARCFGLKLYLSVRSTEISRRVVLMRLEQAQSEGTLIEQIMTEWRLEERPSIDDIAMVYDLGGDIVIQRAVAAPTIEEVEVPMTTAETSTLMCEAKEREDADEDEVTVHVSRKSSFTLDGNSPFDFGQFGRFDAYAETVAQKRMERRHTSNAPSFTLDMFDEHDPFEEWDGEGEGEDVAVLESERWGQCKLRMSVAEMSPTLDGCSDDEMDVESLAHRLQELTSQTSRERIKRMVSL